MKTLTKTDKIRFGVLFGALGAVLIAAAVVVVVSLLPVNEPPVEEFGDNPYFTQSYYTEDEQIAVDTAKVNDAEVDQRLSITDYTYMWWENGLRTTGDDRRLNIQTGKYGLSYDPYNLNITKLGVITDPKTEEEAAKEDNAVIAGLEDTSTAFSVTYDGNTYTNAKCPDMVTMTFPPQTGNSNSDYSNYAYRMIESGRLVQRFDTNAFNFLDTSDVKGHVEFQAMPDYVSILYELIPQKKLTDVTASFSLTIDPSYKNAVWFKNRQAVCFTNDKGEGITIVVPEQTAGTPVMELQDNKLIFTLTGLDFDPVLSEKDRPENKDYYYRDGFNVIVIPEVQASVASAKAFLAQEKVVVNSQQGVADSRKAPTENEVTYDQRRGIVEVIKTPVSYRVTADGARDNLETVLFSMENPTDIDVKIPVTFYTKPYEGRDTVEGSAGCISILREYSEDGSGYPTGAYVQLSKNWHFNHFDKQRELYDGQWIRCTVLIEIPAYSRVKYDLTTAYQNWGGVPTVSHAQLCLIGWGGNQIWDQVAIGSIFENICYEPDGTQRFDGSMIDDVRPLFVGSEWSGTGNVGGGNFLVYFKEQMRQYQARVKTDYLAHGPNLSTVAYNYITMDGSIAATVEVATGRTDDIARNWHTVRYQVLKDTTFDRLAFYQLGSDGYNDHAVGKLAYGNAEGAIRYDLSGEDRTDADQDGYVDANSFFEMTGTQRWAALYNEIPTDGNTANFANRGIIIREWDAVLGGEEVPNPYLASHITYNSYTGTSVNWEITAPPELKELKAGDYVTMVVELDVLPQNRSDYYGPNTEVLDKMFGYAENGLFDQPADNTYMPVWFSAVANAVSVEVKTGTLESTYPLRIRAEDDVAEMTITGGCGYLPIAVSGLSSYKAYELQLKEDGEWKTVDQSVYGNDFWQCDYDAVTETYTLTYNVPRNGEGQTTDFRLVKVE